MKNHHGNKPTAARETSGVIAFDAGTQWSVLHCFSTNRYPLRWTGSIGGDPSPCYDKLKLLVTEVDTHTRSVLYIIIFKITIHIYIYLK